MSTETLNQKPLWQQADNLTTELAQLDALLVNTCGGSSESFFAMGYEQRDCYLMLCSQIAFKCLEVTRGMAEQGAAEARRVSEEVRHA